jgi:predicted site-specific integrase-resolvase
MRFGFDLFKSVCGQYNTLVEIVDISQKSSQEELVDDLVQIITVFSCRLQGRRAKKTKETLKELLKDVQNNESSASTDSGARKEI